MTTEPQFIVSWDGPEAGKRAYQTWDHRANAEAHYERKLRAGLNPSLYSNEDDIDIALASRQLESQP